MDITIYPKKLNGNIKAIPSKSHAHRLLICAAFSDSDTYLECPETNADIEATANCLQALGATITRTNLGYHIIPIKTIPTTANLNCGESGSTLRFILPIVCALGIEATLHMEGRLPYRPLSPLWEELTRMGCSLSRPKDNLIVTNGKLQSGEYVIAGNVSSQFITGLIYALSLLEGKSKITVTGEMESKPYVMMTLAALSTFGVNIDHFHVHGCFPYQSPGKIKVEGDWSNSAFFLAAQAMGSNISISNLDVNSHQGDKSIVDLLQNSNELVTISARDIPDLVPILAVYFATKDGAVFTDIKRLRLKESNRVDSVRNMLSALGIKSLATENSLTVYGGQFTSGTIDACNDHRIAMAAAIAATAANGPVTILGAECVAKSYPGFWDEYKRLGGKYEQYIR